MRLLFSLILAGSAILCGCRGGDPLNADTAMALLKDRNAETVKISFGASPPRDAGDAVADAYKRLTDSHVIQCSETQGLGKICQPGPAGDALTVTGTTELSLTAGRWVPQTIGAISQSGGGTATTDVRMTFEPNPLYQEFQTAFDALQSPGSSVGMEKLKNGKTVHATYQRDEEGWHLSNVE